MGRNEADRQLMEDYATLNLAKDDAELDNQMASGYFAVLSGKVFELREMKQGDEKVCLCNFELNFKLTSLDFITRSPSRLPTQMPRRRRESYRIRIAGVGNIAPDGEDARCLSRRDLL
jgi:hypothetical protein